LKPIHSADDPQFWWRRAGQARSAVDRETEPGRKRAM